MLTFATSLMILLVVKRSTKVSEKSDMAKSWAARLCRLPQQELFVAQELIKKSNYSAAEFRKDEKDINICIILCSMV